ncbi:FecR domain-containing protein [Mucilaginibacter sp. RB4R14]|uniref:FecR family protein n=1 Tax=Mucilaginibacter aurantiaciroseus TaxID=2949308 RepID=UPI0020910C96|nr:FecR domain-containing protein [Mucilaginibacter aurantiaciroseus]MCO5934722.1 FecR domain-containing protein [Mucilaginibacter aurantiaciroseus]
MDYINFNIEDFLTDESFINYCYELNEADKTHWENIILTQPLLKKKIADARELCLLLSIKISKEEKQDALTKLKASIAAEQLKTKSIQITNIRRLWMPRIAIAATLLVLAIGYGLYRYNAPISGAVLYSQVTNNNYHMVAQTNFSNRKVVVLPDGSTVSLNGSSSLKIANDYNTENRHVLLTGEAFFEVTKDKTRPFVVLTNKTATTALGTSFKVTSYGDARTASVMLSTGKVKVEATQTQSKIADQVLIPGQQVVLAEGNNSFTKSDFDQVEIQNWRNSRLVFTNADFKDIAAKIANTYGVVIKADEKEAGKIMFTGQFNNKKLTDVLDAIGFVNKFTYNHDGSTVKLVF